MHVSYVPGGQGESGHIETLLQPNSFSSSSGMQSSSVGQGSLHVNAGHSINASHQLGVLPSSPSNVGLLTSASRVPIWKIAKHDWAKLFAYVLEHNMNTKKPKQIFACLSVLGIPVKGSEKAFRGKWCLHRSKLEKFALLYIEARRGDLRDTSLETIKSTSGVRKYTRIYSDPVTALSLGLHIIKEKQRRAAKDAIMIAALQTLDKNNPVVSNGMHYEDDDSEESSGEIPDDDDSLDDDDLAGVMGIPPPPHSSSSKKKRSSSSSAAVAASAASPLSHLNLPGHEKRSSRKRENEDITAKASSALAEMRRIQPPFASPQHSKRNKIDSMMNNNNGSNGGGLMSNQVMNQDHLAFDDRYGFLGSLQPQVNTMPQQQPSSSSSSTSSSTLKKRLDDLGHSILKTNERLTALEAGFQKITNLEKKLDHFLDRVLRSAAKTN